MTSIRGGSSNEPCAKRPRLDYESPTFESESGSTDNPGSPKIESERNPNVNPESDLAEEILELETQVVCLKQDIERLRLSNEQFQKQDTLNKTQTEFFITQVDMLNTRLTKLENDLEVKNVTMSEMQKEIDKLKESVKEHERNRIKLYLCQVAVEFEHAVCSHVLPEVFKKDDFATIRRLLKIINGGRPLPFKPKGDIEKMLIRARKRWRDLCDKLKLPEE